jgi:uncharacterized protein YndB with AHSA1/START domain
MTPLDDISQSIDIAAPVERVWRVLTSEGLVEEWLGCLGYRAVVGTVFYMQPDAARRAAGDATGATHCELLALEPPVLMTFSWFMPGTPKTTVNIALAPERGGTRVTLTHSGWDQFDPDQVRAIRDGLDGGWSSFVLPQLKRVVEAASVPGDLRPAAGV